MQSGDSYIVGTTKNCIISGADMCAPNVITQVIEKIAFLMVKFIGVEMLELDIVDNILLLSFSNT